MKARKVLAIVLALLVLFVLLSAQVRKTEGASSTYGTTERVSISSDGIEANATSSPNEILSISSDGRYVVFASYASNLVAGDTNNSQDVFVRDRLTRQTTRISVASGGTQGNGQAFGPSISGDGRYIAFRSDATNIVSSGAVGIFVHDQLTGQTTCVAPHQDPGGPACGGSLTPSISGDGRYIAFGSGSYTLVPNDTNGTDDIFTYDLITGQITRVSVASDGTQANGPSYSPTISADGRYVAFTSEATNLVVGDTNGKRDIFIHDNQTGQTNRVSIASDGTQSNDHSYDPSISLDGRYVVFTSMANNLTVGDVNVSTDIFAHDMVTGETTLVSISSNGTQGNQSSTFPSVSKDGNLVAFASYANNLAEGDTNNTQDIFVRNRAEGTTKRVSIASNGEQGNASSGWPEIISADGRYVAFTSDANNLVVGDTNSVTDVFVHDQEGEISPILDLPIGYTNFAQAAQGNIGGQGPGKVNSWFDHQYPTYGNPPNNTYPGLLRWDGRLFPNPTKIGEGWYDGHSGIDLQGNIGEQVFPAAPGIVFGVVTSCQVGNLACGGGFGNQLWINHQDGYATRYGHLSSVLVTNGASVSTQAIGTIGITGNSSGPHLHFGVYFDVNNDGVWNENEVVDPYGWFGTGTDPWSPTSQYLWKYPIWLQQSVGFSGALLTSPSGRTTASIPSGALAVTSTVELWDAPVSQLATQFRSVGTSFWLRVLEWLTGGLAPSKVPRQSTTNVFAQPVTVSATFDPGATAHLDTNQLAIQWWSEAMGTWTPLATSLSQNTATAQTTQAGNFDLQAPLLCAADSREPDDASSTATVVTTDGTVASDLFDIQVDKDWFKFNAQAGTKYTIETLNLAAGVDTVLELYGTDATTLLATDDNSGGGKASKINWQAPSSGTYFVLVKQAIGSVFGCSANYQLRVSIPQNKIYLPIILK